MFSVISFKQHTALLCNTTVIGLPASPVYTTVIGLAASPVYTLHNSHWFTCLTYVLLLHYLGKQVNCIVLTLATKVTHYHCTNKKYPVYLHNQSAPEPKSHSVTHVYMDRILSKSYKIKSLLIILLIYSYLCI